MYAMFVSAIDQKVRNTTAPEHFVVCATTDQWPWCCVSIRDISSHTGALATASKGNHTSKYSLDFCKGHLSSFRDSGVSLSDQAFVIAIPFLVFRPLPGGYPLQPL